MSRVQRFFQAIFPAKWSVAMEAESREWIARCRCGHGRSIWELGGIRWKGRGKPSTFLKCPQCGEWSMHTIRRETAG